MWGGAGLAASQHQPPAFPHSVLYHEGQIRLALNVYRTCEQHKPPVTVSSGRVGVKVRKMRAEQFLKNPFTIAEEWEENETALQMYKDYKETNIDALITFHSNTDDRKDEEDRDLRLRILKEIIAWKLGIPMFEYVIDVLDEKFDKLETEIKKLNKFKEHRHKTIMGLYTEKAVY